jgi:acyl carrier protein
MAIERATVVEKVRTHLADILEIDPSSVSEDQSFVDDLGADSIALIELVDSLEQDFSVDLPDFQFDDDDLVNLKTVRDAVDYVVAAYSR